MNSYNNEIIEDQIDFLNSEERFFTMESENGFIQASKFSTEGTKLEYQDSKFDHYIAKRKDITDDELKDILSQYLKNPHDGSWKDSIEWIFVGNFYYPSLKERIMKKIHLLFNKN